MKIRNRVIKIYNSLKSKQNFSARSLNISFLIMILIYFMFFYFKIKETKNNICYKKNEKKKNKNYLTIHKFIKQNTNKCEVDNGTFQLTFENENSVIL